MKAGVPYAPYSKKHHGGPRSGLPSTLGIMKEYKLSAWPDLPASFHRTSFRRMLSDMSHRFVTVQQLMAGSGASRMEVRMLLQMLGERGLLAEREAERNATASFGAWLRRALHGDRTELSER